MSITANEIKKALSIRHGQDFFTTECMSGPQRVGVYRFDAVAITKSWTHPKFIGYEIKVSRSDFKADNKFYAYLPYFHELYIACPKGMIAREELPENIGLVWYNPDTRDIRAKKRAPYRKIEINTEMLLHIFYSHLNSDRTPFSNDKAEFARQYLQDKKSLYDIGQRLGTNMAKKLDEQTELLRRYTRRGKDLRILDTVEQVLQKHHIFYLDNDDLVEKLDNALSRSYPQELNYIRNGLNQYIDKLNKICVEEV